MPIVDIPIGDGFHVARSLPLAALRCINWYPLELVLPPGEVVTTALYGTAGMNQLATTGLLISEANRGAWTLEGVPYFVNGTTLYRLESDFTITTTGTITGSGPVSLADNGIQLFILVPGTTSTGYIFTANPDTLTTISDADFKANGQPQTVIFTDGYFLLTTDSKKFITSALNNGLAYNALDFGSAEYNPDAIVAPFQFKSQVFMFGLVGAEVFVNTAAPIGIPYERQTGFVLSKGLFAKNSLVAANETFMWLGGGINEGPAIWALSGNGVVKVSDDGIESLLETEAANGIIGDVFAFSYSESGSYFVAWTLADTTIVYDTQAKRWHERQSKITNDEGTSITRWRVSAIVQAYGKTIVADSIDGRIGQLSLSINTEYGEIVERTIDTRPFANQSAPFTVPYIELTMESGVGNENAVDPKIRMSRSLDARLFTDERPRSVGTIGEYQRRIAWRRNGRAARFEIFRWEFAEDAKAVIIRAQADIRPLRA